MSIETLLRHPIVVNRRSLAAVDVYGVQQYATVASTLVLGFAEPFDSSENTTDRDTADTTLEVFLPAGTVVSGHDTLTIDGAEWQVDGEPSLIRRPQTDVVHHIELRARRVA